MNMISDIPISNIVLFSGLCLILIGLWGMLTQRNMIRMIVGFSLTDTGVHMVMVSIGYVTGGTAPIINDAVPMADAVNRVVDPVPSALVLTANPGRVSTPMWIAAIPASLAVPSARAHVGRIPADATAAAGPSCVTTATGHMTIPTATSACRTSPPTWTSRR